MSQLKWFAWEGKCVDGKGGRGRVGGLIWGGLLLVEVMCWVLVGVGGAPSSIAVMDCQGLKNELGREDGADNIVVAASFMCNRTVWGAPVQVNRNVTVRGTGIRFPAIDWKDSSKVLVAGDEVMLTFKHLVFLQDEMGVGGIHLGFFSTENFSHGRFSGIVVGVRSCPETFTSFPKTIQHVPRPDSLPGSQAVTVRGANTLLVDDMGILWTQTESIWRLCNLLFECGVSSLEDPRLKYLFEDPVIQDDAICPERPDTTLASGENSGSKFAELKAVIFGTFSAIIVVVFLVALCIWKKKKQEESQDKQKPVNVHPEVSEVDEEITSQPLVPASSFRNWNINLSEVEVGSSLGRGGFGKVYKGCWQGTTVAVKIIRHSDRLLQTNLGEPFEAFLSQHISHPNVVQTYHISVKERKDGDGSGKSNGGDETKDDIDSSQVNDLFPSFGKEDGIEQPWPVGSPQYETWIVLEYCDLGSLQKSLAEESIAIKSGDQVSKMSSILQTALEIASAMNYLHSFRIIHGDLKPGNVLLKSDGSQPRGFICKVGDFGLSRVLDEDSHIETFTCGTVTHMPPELLKGGVLSPAADVYSFGILLWEMVTGESPYSGKNQGEIILDVVNDHDRPKLPSYIPDEYSSLAMDCWQHDHELRPAFPAIIDRIRKMLKKYEDNRNIGYNPSGALAVGPMIDSTNWPAPSIFTSSTMSGHIRSTSQHCEMSVMRSPYDQQIDAYGRYISIDSAPRAIRGYETNLANTCGLQGHPGHIGGNISRHYPVSADHARLSNNKSRSPQTIVSNGLMQWRPVSEDARHLQQLEVPAITTFDSMFLSESEISEDGLM